MQSPFRRASGARPLVLGHRGARHGAPENTLRAFDLAASEGADGIELDVRLCGSGELVVLHDPTLSRVSGGRDPRHAEELDYAELCTVDVGEGERVPLLEDVLDWALRLNMLVDVEVKPDVRDRTALLTKTAELVRSHAAGKNVLLSSFDPRFVHWLARELPDVPVGWLFHARQPLFKTGAGHRLLGARAVHPEDALVTPELMSAWRRHDSLVNVWTVNDPERARWLGELGVDAIISDEPGKILEHLL